MKANYLSLVLVAFIITLFTGCGKDEPTLTLDPVTGVLASAISSSGDKGTITFVASDNWTAQVVGGNSNWITLSPSSGQGGTVTMTINVMQNDSYDPRSANIILTCGSVEESFSIEQNQKDAIIIASNEYELNYNDKTLEVDLQTNTDFSVIIDDEAKDWIKTADTRSLNPKKMVFNISENNGICPREASITFKSNSVEQTIKVKQIHDYLSVEKSALIDIYNSTAGDNWNVNTDWLSDLPVSYWNGITVNDEGAVTKIVFWQNNLDGELPKSIGNFYYLEELYINYNNVSGNLPEEIGNLKHLKRFDIHNNRFTGRIPESIGNLKELEYIELSDNSFSNSIPETIGKLTNLKQIECWNNPISGSIPESIGNLENLEEISIGYTNISGPIPESIGNLQKLKGLYILCNRISGEIPSCIGNLTNLEYIVLNSNYLTGNIPESFVNLIKLNYCDLTYNKLNGEIPLSLVQWVKKCCDYSPQRNGYSLTLPEGN